MDPFVDSCLFCYSLLWSQGSLCQECAKIYGASELIFREEKGLPIFSAFHYGDGLREVARVWKNPHQESSTKVFARVLAQKLAWQCLVPVNGVIPMPPKASGKRDHAYFIAEALAEHFKVPVAAEFLERKDLGEQKTKKLENRKATQLALKSDFQVHDSTSGLWLLVDDVVTSGGTLVNAWNALGKPRAIGATLASTPRYIQ